MHYTHYFLSESGAQRLVETLDAEDKPIPRWLMEVCPHIGNQSEMNLAARVLGSEVDSYLLKVTTTFPQSYTP